MCRCLSRRTALSLLAGAAVLPLSGCFEGDRTGPEDIAWDRDTCTLCNMMISDARFTAQVRGGPKRTLYKFDDVGGAVNWLNNQPWAGDKETEFWVAAEDSTREKMNWLKARDAYFFSGDMTPMNYGFSATASARPDNIDFVQMTTRILGQAPNHICAIPREGG